MEDAGEEDDSRFLENWVGLHVGFDFGIVSGTRICAAEGYADDFRCYDPNNPNAVILTNRYPERPEFSSSIENAVIYTSTRLLASYDRVLASRFTVGARAGFAFGGAPVNFLPLHLEAHAALWIRPIHASGFRPYVSLGGGMAQADAHMKVTNREDINPQDGIPEDIQYDAYKHMGRFFAKLGLGFVYPLSASIGLQVNLNGMYMIPSSGIVVEPSLGAVYGF
jgi:hypothetical protein